MSALWISLFLQEETEVNRAAPPREFTPRPRRAQSPPVATSFANFATFVWEKLRLKALLPSVSSCKRYFALLGVLWGGVSTIAAPVEVVLEPVRSLVVSAPVDGVIESIAVDEGDAVQTGAALVTLVHAAEDLAVERAREVLRKREFDFAGVEQLFKDNMTSETEKLEKEIERGVAEIDLANAREQRERRLIKAVHDGVVTVRHHEAGEYVERGEPLLGLVDASELDARFYVRPEEGLQLAVGDTVWIHVPLAEATLSCRIVFVDPLIDPSSGLMRARARVDNRAGRFKPGLRGWVSLGAEQPTSWP